MAGKFNYTCNNGSKRNGTGKSATTHGSNEAKKWRENSTTRASRGENGGNYPKPHGTAEAKKWRKQRMVGYVLPELAASWTRGLKVWTLVQVAVGSTHHLGVLQVALHIKQRK